MKRLITSKIRFNIERLLNIFFSPSFVVQIVVVESVFSAENAQNVVQIVLGGILNAITSLAQNSNNS